MERQVPIIKFFLALDPFPEVAHGRLQRTPILEKEAGFFYFKFRYLPEVMSNRGWIHFV